VEDARQGVAELHGLIGCERKSVFVDSPCGVVGQESVFAVELFLDVCGRAVDSGKFSGHRAGKDSSVAALREFQHLFGNE